MDILQQCIDATGWYYGFVTLTVHMDGQNLVSGRSVNVIQKTTHTQIGRFSGKQMVVSGDEASGFELHFLGFIERIYPTIEHAKAAAPIFARLVLAQIRAEQRSAGN